MLADDLLVRRASIRIRGRARGLRGDPVSRTEDHAPDQRHREPAPSDPTAVLHDAGLSSIGGNLGSPVDASNLLAYLKTDRTSHTGLTSYTGRSAPAHTAPRVSTFRPICQPRPDPVVCRTRSRSCTSWRGDQLGVGAGAPHAQADHAQSQQYHRDQSPPETSNVADPHVADPTPGARWHSPTLSYRS